MSSEANLDWHLLTILDTSSCLFKYSMLEKSGLKTRLTIVRLCSSPLCAPFPYCFSQALVPLFQAMERDKVDAYHQRGFVSWFIWAVENIHLPLDLAMTRTDLQSGDNVISDMARKIKLILVRCID